jgi:hypothetical protein
MKFRLSIDIKTVFKTNKENNALMKFNSVFNALSPTIT